MLYALFSDVHGNIEALEKVLAFYKTQAIDRFIFLGDAVGYGPNPNDTCDALRQLTPLTAVLGNHDAAVSDRMAYDEYYDAAKHSLDWTKEQLLPLNRDWLKGIPFKVREGDYTFSHGCPILPESFDYIFIPEQILDLYDVWDEFSQITFIGHSHLSIAFRFNEESVTTLIADSIECQPGHRYIITVGSVGQPRDRDPRACCGLFDTETKRFTYHRFEYEKEKTKDKITKAGLAAAFGERLLLGM